MAKCNNRCRIFIFLFVIVLGQSLIVAQSNSCFSDEQRNIIPEKVVYVAVESHEFNEGLNKGLTNKFVTDALFALAETRAMLFCYYHGFDRLVSFSLSYRNADSFKLGTAFEFVWMLFYEPVTHFPRAKLDLPKPSDREQPIQQSEHLDALLGNSIKSDPESHVPHLVFTDLVCAKKSE